MPLSYTLFPHRIDSSAPHCARLMMFGGCPGAWTAVGGDHVVSAGACGGVISTALRFCPNGCSTLAGTYPRFRVLSFGPALGFAALGLVVGGGGARAPAGRVTAICTAVVWPTKTGSVPRGP
jgi:hypothetical protein